MSTFNDQLGWLKACAEPTRLRLLRLLLQGELTVTEAVAILDQAQPSVSRHLRILADAGLVSRHQEGSWVFYGAELPDALVPLIEDLTGDTLAADDARLAEVRAARAATAQRYFAKHAEEWDALRRRHLPETEVEAALKRLAGTGPGRGVRRLVDLGTGTGRMLVLFDGAYDAATGYDVSPEMLAVARARLDAAGAVKARLRRGDLMTLDAEAGSVDIVVMHHVLHFLADPARAVAGAGRLLAPKGRLLIADFAPHQREELRERHAHRRLGFSSAELRRAAETADLLIVEEVAIPATGPDGLTALVWRLERATDQEEAIRAA
jgi:ubiquinone/menaquinone biosynthesis C-methylase UbiE